MFLATELSWSLFLGTGHQSQPETVVTIKLRGTSNDGGNDDPKVLGGLPGTGTAFVAVVTLPTLSIAMQLILTHLMPSVHTSGC